MARPTKSYCNQLDCPGSSLCPACRKIRRSVISDTLSETLLSETPLSVTPPSETVSDQVSDQAGWFPCPETRPSREPCWICRLPLTVRCQDGRYRCSDCLQRLARL